MLTVLSLHSASFGGNDHDVPAHDCLLLRTASFLCNLYMSSVINGCNCRGAMQGVVALVAAGFHYSVTGSRTAGQTEVIVQNASLSDAGVPASSAVEVALFSRPMTSCS